MKSFVTIFSECLIIFLVLALWSCSGGSASETSESGTTTGGGGAPTSSGGSVGGGGSNSGGGGSRGNYAEEPGQTPTSVAGANLVEILCESSRDDSTSTSNLTCNAYASADSVEAVALNLSSGNEAVKVLATNVDIEWSITPNYYEFQSKTCIELNGGATYSCDFSETNIAITAEVSAIIKVDNVELKTLQTTAKFLNECEALPATCSGDNCDYNAYGEGTITHPYLWCYSEQLTDFANNRCNHLTSEECDASIRVGRDLDGSNVSSMIASKANKYTGRFFGNGYKLSDITLTMQNTFGQDFAGIFREIGDGAILDYFTIENADIAQNYCDHELTSVGLLAGKAFSGSVIRNITVVDSNLISGISASDDCQSAFTLDPGGIVGHLEGDLSNSQVSNTTLGTAFGSVGGIAAKVLAGGTISDSSVNLTISMAENAGGVAFQNYGTITNVSADIVIQGLGYSAGIVTENYSIINKCAAQVDLDNTGYGGGVSVSNHGSISNCYVHGIVGGVHTDVAGGIVASAYNSSSIAYSYSTASIRGGVSYGGLVGDEWGTVTYTANYWDKTTSGVVLATGPSAGDVPGITGLTTAQMQTQSSFVGWDFTTIWQILTGEYPTLR